MKKPRVEDFDPNTAPSLGSPFDGLPAIERSGSTVAASGGVAPPSVLQRPAPAAAEPQYRPPIRPYARTPGRRTITRYAFELFQDQIETLRRHSLEEKLLGGKGSMSEMVREAIDAYLARRNRTEGG
jgi:hypothetical protein